MTKHFYSILVVLLLLTSSAWAGSGNYSGRASTGTSQAVGQSVTSPLRTSARVVAAPLHISAQPVLMMGGMMHVTAEAFSKGGQKRLPVSKETITAYPQPTN